MKLETLRTYLLERKGATEERPFGPEALVFKVMGKMFALVAWEETPLCITLKCDPDDALALRDQYESVQPGYYMSKRHWNTITLDGSIPNDAILEMIDDSYDLVVKGLKKLFGKNLKDINSERFHLACCGNAGNLGRPLLGWQCGCQRIICLQILQTETDWLLGGKTVWEKDASGGIL